MQRDMLLDHLKVVAQHVAQGARHVRSQRQIAARLEKTDYARSARELLTTFQELQKIREEDFERVVDLLASRTLWSSSSH